jgi:hypothetical protein
LKNFLYFILVFGIQLTLSSTSMATPQAAHFKKVVWIVFENTDYDKALKQPDFAHFASQGALLTDMHAAIHPSQGNYISMIAGSTFGIKNDKPVDLSELHLGDLLEKNRMDWRAYAEGYPGNCFLGSNHGMFARKHVPFLSFTNVTTNPERCAKIEDTGSFQQDLFNDRLPEYSLYIPNMENDGHDSGVDFAGRWLKTHFGNILNAPEKFPDILFVLTFDESSGASQSNQIYTVLIGNQVQKGVKNSQSLTHPALLKMIEDELGLGHLGREDSKAPSVSGIWK